jgi:hypothetical protein
LRLSGDDRISFRFRRGDELGWPQDVLDKARLLEMLTTYLRFPFESVDDFKVLIGQSGVYAEVRVFSGSIQWPRQPLEGRPDALLGWEIKSDPDNKARLFITDSEPQYFCISVDTDGPD